jgi:RNA polymerase sigma-70 factor, ECF subfamily
VIDETHSLEERRLLHALRAGDEAAFVRLHELYDTRLLSLAMAQGCSRAVAEEVVQETWASVARSIRAFEGRSALKTWIFRILLNAAHAQVKRERRSVPLSSVEDNVVDLDAVRNLRASASPHEHVVWKEMLGELRAAIAGLPPSQAKVITLRDLRGLSAPEVCEELGISEANQRVLLHRARTTVRRTLAAYVGEAA